MKLISPNFLSGFIICLMLSIVSSGDAKVVNLKLDTSINYDSNLFRTSEHPQSDFFLAFAPQLLFQKNFSRTSFQVDSNFILERYFHYTEVNFQEVVFEPLIGYKLSDRLSFKIQDELSNSKNSKLEQAASDTTELLSYFSNQVTPAITYKHSNGMLIDLSYSNALRDYKDSTNNDWKFNSAIVSFQYPIGTKTSASLHFGLKQKAFASDIVYLGRFVNFELSRKLPYKFISAKASLGWEDRNYTVADEKLYIHSPLFDIGITGKLSPNLPLTLSFKLSLEDSDYYIGQALIPFGPDISLSWNLTPKIQFNFEGALSRNQYLENTFLDFFKHLDFGLFGKLQVVYRIRTRREFHFTYQYENRNSQNKEIGYRQSLLNFSFVFFY